MNDLNPFKLLYFCRAELAALPDCQPPYLKVSQARAAEFKYRMPDCLEHAAHLTVFALMYDDFRYCRIAVVLQQMHISR